jgi:tetratricopeptide (TPR) repeat protein
MDMETVHVWETETGKSLVGPLACGSMIQHVAFHPDGVRFAVAATSPGARLWNADTGKPVSPALPDTLGVTFVTFSPDGKRLLTAGANHEARIWDVEAGKLAGKPMVHRDNIAQASFSPDGRRIATASEDTTARIWDAVTQEALTPPLTHQGKVRQVEFSPDGRYVATASEDHTARIWDAATGQPITAPLQYDASVKQVAFSSDGRRLLVVAGPRLEIRDVPSAPEKPDDLLALVPMLAGHRLHPTAGLVPLEPAALRQAWEQVHGHLPETLPATRADTLAWHEARARAALHQQEWAGCLFHLDRLLQEPKPTATMLARWARCHAELGHWQQAAAGFERSFEAQNDPDVARGYFLCRLALGNRKTYRELCASLANELPHADPARAGAFLWLCSLVDEGVSDYAPLLAAAERAVEKKPQGPDEPRTLGALLYRAGRYPEAVTRLEAAVQAQGQGGTAFDFLFLAMSEQKRGNPDAARRWLDAAGKAGARFPWEQRAQLDALRQEAEGLVKRP